MEKIIQSLFEFDRKSMEAFGERQFMNRKAYDKINKKFKIVWIVWLRWVWKSFYLLHQRSKTPNSMYISCDWMALTWENLFDIVNFIYKNHWITYFYLDEIHEIIQRDQALKNIYDLLPVKIIFSGSSMINITNTSFDLSRRALLFQLPIFSYAEFLSFRYKKIFDIYPLDYILSNHITLSRKLSKYHTQSTWQDYLQTGQFGYRFIKDFEKNTYYQLLQNSVKKSLYQDMTTFIDIGTENLKKFESVLFFIANSTPSEINANALAHKIGITNKTMEIYIEYLSKLWWLICLEKDWNLTDIMRKKQKFFISTTNLINYLYQWSDLSTLKWITRESFFASNIKNILEDRSSIKYLSQTDFAVQIAQKKYFFEIGGKSKSRNEKNIFVIKDNIDIWYQNIIPLWLLWFIA